MRELPKTLDQLENDYNTRRTRFRSLPTSDRWPRPEYRPPPSGSADNRFVVIVERPSPYWYDIGTFVTFAKADGSDVEMRIVDEEELDRLLCEDDAMRQVAQSR